MGTGDTAFIGQVPVIYDRYLVPMLFQPYAEDLVGRLQPAATGAVLEIAAGTGVVTRLLADIARTVVATDLNAAMLQVAAERVTTGNVTFQPADAQHLPFDDGSFDTVVCQFGVMFVPDKARMYADLNRVLRPGGQLLFSVWDRIEANPVPYTVSEAAATRFPDDPPQFMRRVPHGYYDTDAIVASLDAFDRVAVETVVLPCRAPSYRDAAIGFCQGTPFRDEITSRAPDELDAVTELAAVALAARFGVGAIDSDSRAFVISARR